MRRLLLNYKDQRTVIDMSSVYVLICRDCDERYINQTGQMFSSRIIEHRRCFINNDDTFKSASHLCKLCHFSDFVSMLGITCFELYNWCKTKRFY
jgi:hypothetical protein